METVESVAMPSYSTLYDMSTDLGVDEYVAWAGTHAKTGLPDRTHPNRVTEIETGDDWIRVYGNGRDGADYYYTAYTDGSSEAVHVRGDREEPRGEVYFAIWTDSDDLVHVNEGVHDRRDL
jgi:hypothetical protein